MRSLLTIVTILIVMGLANWAYQENIKTQAAIAKTQTLQTDIGKARARLAALRAEWAYLNRPDRLIDLVNLNYASLQLSPLRADNFGDVEQVAFRDEVQTLMQTIEVVEVADHEGLN